GGAGGDEPAADRDLAGGSTDPDHGAVADPGGAAGGAGGRDARRRVVDPLPPADRAPPGLSCRPARYQAGRPGGGPAQGDGPDGRDGPAGGTAGLRDGDADRGPDQVRGAGRSTAEQQLAAGAEPPGPAGEPGRERPGERQPDPAHRQREPQRG